MFTVRAQHVAGHDRQLALRRISASMRRNPETFTESGPPRGRGCYYPKETTMNIVTPIVRDPTRSS